MTRGESGGPRSDFLLHPQKLTLGRLLNLFGLYLLICKLGYD